MQRFPKLHRSHGRDTFTVHPTAPDNELGYGLGAEDMGFSYGYLSIPAICSGEQLS